jgi:hypothetical protein
MSEITFGLLINSQIGCLDTNKNHSIYRPGRMWQTYIKAF